MSDIVIYEDGNVNLELSVEDKTIWLDANDIASIFDVNRPAIVKHIGNIYKSEELSKEATCSILEQVAKDGKKKMNYYIRESMKEAASTNLEHEKVVCSIFAHTTTGGAIL